MSAARTDRLTLELSSAEALIVVSALRQFEPYRWPGDVDGAQQLSRLAADIKALLSTLQSGLAAAAPPA